MVPLNELLLTLLTWIWLAACFGIICYCGTCTIYLQINKNLLLNRQISDFVVDVLSGYHLNTIFIVLLWHEVDLFHNFLIVPFTSLNWNILNVVLVVEIFASVRLVSNAALRLERRWLWDWFIDDKLVLNSVPWSYIRMSQLWWKVGSEAGFILS